MKTVLAILVAGLLAACSTQPNHPPRVGPIPDLSVVIGETLVWNLTAEDPDGDAIVFEVTGAPEGARVVRGGGTGREEPDAWRFQYAPLASHAKPGGQRYELTFVASDGRGGRTTETTTLTVWPEASIPVFLGPFAWTLNLGNANHLAVLIRVRDDDTARVVLSLKHSLEGARLDPVDGHSAMFSFRPRPSQVAAGAVFTFTVGASDGDHPEVLQDFAIVLVNADLFGGCPGSSPTAVHPRLSDQHAPGPYPIEVFARDPDSEVREVTLFWSAVKGQDEGDMNRVTLDPAGNGVFRGAIPDLSAAGGAGRLVFYHLRVFDDDDPTGGYCDHDLRLPENGQFATAVYGPAGSNVCLDDPALPDDLPRDASGLRLCPGSQDDFGVDLLAGEWLAVSVKAMSFGPDPRIRLLDPLGVVVQEAPSRVLVEATRTGRYRVIVAPQTPEPVTYAVRTAILADACVPDGFEPSGEPHAPASLSEGEFRATLCPADVDDYRFSLAAGEALSLAVRPAEPGADLALTLFQEGDVLPLRFASGPGAERRVVFETDRPVSLWARVSSESLREVPYALMLHVANQGLLCEEDLLGPCPTWQQAPTLFEATWDKLKICPGQSDFFQTGLNGGERLSVAVETEPGQPAPPLAVLGSNGQTVLAVGQSSGELALAEVTAPGPGSLYFRVGPAKDLAMTYTLSFWTKEPPGDCRQDRLEPNDSPDHAAVIPMGFTTHLTLCPGDRDLFALKVGAFEAISAVLLFGSAPARLSLQDGAGNVIARGEPVEYGEDLFYVVGAPQTVYLVVEGVAGPGWYDIGLLVE